jgi:hypothetical protein
VFAQVPPSDKLLRTFINNASSGIGSLVSHSSSIVRKTLCEHKDATAEVEEWKFNGLVKSDFGRLNLDSMWASWIMMTNISSVQKNRDSIWSRVSNNWSTVRILTRIVIEKANESSILKIRNGDTEQQFICAGWMQNSEARFWLKLFDRHCSRISSMALQWDCTYEGFEILLNGFQSLSPYISSLNYRLKSNSALEETIENMDEEDLDDFDGFGGFVGFQKRQYPAMDIKALIVSVFSSFQIMHNFSSLSSTDSISSLLLTWSTLLHQHLFSIVAMVFHSLGIMNPFESNISVSSFRSMNESVSVGDIGFLSKLRHYLHSFLAHAVMEYSNLQRDSTSAAKKTVFSLNQYRRLKTQIGNISCRKKLLDIFRQNPSFSNGVLLCMVIKEFSTLFTTKVVQEDWKMCKDLMDLFIDSDLLPPLTKWSDNQNAEQCSSQATLSFDSDKERSCLMLLLTLWTFNPFPIKIQLASGVKDASSAPTAVTPIVITIPEFMTLTKQLWKDEEEQLLSVSPFLKVVRLIQTIHDNTMKEFRVMTPMVESLTFSAIASLTALVSHWVVSTKEFSNQKVTQNGIETLSVLKLHIFPKELVKSLLALLRIQSQHLQKSTVPMGATASKSSNSGKLNLEIGSLISYTLNVVTEAVQQYAQEVMLPAISFMKRCDMAGSACFESALNIPGSHEEKQELYESLLSFLHQSIESFDEICHDTMQFASSLRIVLSVALNRCRPVNEEFSFIIESFPNTEQRRSTNTKFDFSASSWHQQINARDQLKFMTCQNLSHVTLQTLINLHQVLLWRGSVGLPSASITSGIVQNNHVNIQQSQQYYSNPQDFFHSFHQILQGLIDRDASNTGLYVVEHWLWRQYLECWFRFPRSSFEKLGHTASRSKPIYDVVIQFWEAFINHYLGRIVQVEWTIRMIFKSKFKLFTLCAKEISVIQENVDFLSPAILSNVMKDDANLLHRYYEAVTCKLSLSPSTSWNHVLIQAWSHQDHLGFDIQSVELQLVALYQNGLKWLRNDVHVQHLQQFQQYIEKLHKQILQVIYFLRLCSFHSDGSRKQVIDQQLQHLMKIFVQCAAFTVHPTWSSQTTAQVINMSNISLISIENINKYFRDFLSISTRQLCESLHNLLRKPSMDDHQPIHLLTRRRVDLNQYLVNLILHIRLVCLTPFSTRCVDWDVILYPMLMVAFHEAYWMSIWSEELVPLSTVISSMQQPKKKTRVSQEFVEQIMELLEEIMVQFLLAMIFPSLTTQSDQWEGIVNTILTNGSDQQRITPSIYFMDNRGASRGLVNSHEISKKMEMWKRCMARNAIVAKEASQRWRKLQGDEMVAASLETKFTKCWSTPNQSAFSQYLFSSVSPTQLSPPWKKAITVFQSQNLIPVSMDVAQGVAFDLMKRIQEYYVLMDDIIVMYSMAWD